MIVPNQILIAFFASYNGDDQEVVYVNQRDYPTTTAYNGLAQTSLVTNAVGDKYRFGYDKAGLNILQVDWNGNPTKYDHDGRRLMTRMDDAEGGVHQYIIDGGRRTTEFIDPRGNSWLSGYNKNDWQTSWTDPLLGEFSRTFDGVGNIKTELLPLTTLGEETSYDHDELNRITSVTLPDGAQSFNTWDANDNLTVYQDFRGNQYTYGYNNMNLLTSMGTPENQNFSYTYDAVYNMTVFNDGNGEDWTSVYDALNRKIKDINPLSKEVEWVYDPTSNVIRFDDQEDDSYQTIYDPLNRPIEQIDPLLHKNKIEYDANSNVTATIDANNFKTEYKHDGLNRRYEIKDARGFITQIFFDPNSNMTKLIDGVGNTTNFEFDERNLLTKRTDPNGNDVTNSYNANWQLTSTTDRNGRRRDFEYDENGRVKSEKWYDSGSQLLDTLSYTYDPNSNLLTASNAEGTYTMTYDKVNRPKSSQDIWNKTLNFSYDGNGNRTQVTDSDGGVTDSVYDAANRLTQRTFSGTGQTPLRFNFTYTDDNRIKTETRYSDLAGTTKVASSEYGYDAAGRLTDLTHKDGSDVSFADYDFTYDPGNRLTSETLNTVTKNYNYDATNQLTDDNGQNYSYDGTGNRTNTGYTTTTGNRLTSDGTWTYHYDDEGNLTKKTKGANDETWTYGYDNRNQMTWAEKRATDGGTLETRADYAYDVFGNRVEKEVDNDGDSTIDLTERYAYDGFKPGSGFIGNENWDIWADLDDTSSLTTRYVRGNAIDQLFSRIDSGGTAAHYFVDHIGSVRHMTDNSGTLQNTIAYDGFGNVTSESSPAFGDRYTYASRERDVETGFYYNRARYYNPAVGRWTSEDPLGFRAGDSNLYRYVKNNSTVRTDPSGLQNRQFDYQSTIRYYQDRLESASFNEAKNLYRRNIAALHFMQQLDLNKDGNLSLQEFQAKGKYINSRWGHDKKIINDLFGKVGFNKIDISGDNALSMSELAARMPLENLYDEIADSHAKAKLPGIAKGAKVNGPPVATAKGSTVMQAAKIKGVMPPNAPARIHTTPPVGGPQAIQRRSIFVDIMNGLNTAAQQIQELSPEERALLLDLAQFGLDIGGVVEQPTPFCDLGSTVISGCRGDLTGAGIGMLSMIPIFGDFSKLAKIPGYIRSAFRAIAVASRNSRFAVAARPLFRVLHRALSRFPVERSRLPQNVQRQIMRLRSALEGTIARTLSRTEREIVDFARRRGAGDCEQTAIVLSQRMPGGRSVRFAENCLHEVYVHNDRVFDLTSSQYLRHWPQRDLEAAGLADAVQTGVFTIDEHIRFMSRVTPQELTTADYIVRSTRR